MRSSEKSEAATIVVHEEVDKSDNEIHSHPGTGRVHEHVEEEIEDKTVVQSSLFIR